MVSDDEIKKTIKKLSDESLRLAHPGKDKTTALVCTALMQILELLQNDRSSVSRRHQE